MVPEALVDTGVWGTEVPADVLTLVVDCTVETLVVRAGVVPALVVGACVRVA